MTSLLLAMLRSRAGIAATTFLLTAFAVAAALAGPLYADAAARSTVAVEVNAAPVAERTVTGDLLLFRGTERDIEKYPYVHGFDTVAGAMSNGTVETELGGATLWMGSRTGVCGYLTILKGRCFSADREVVLRQDTAAMLGLDVGSELDFVASTFGGGQGSNPVRVTVVGIYQSYLATDAYWADRFMFAGGEGGPILTSERTVRAMNGPVLLVIDLIGSPEGFADRSRMMDEVRAAQDILTAGGFEAYTEADVLAARLDDAGDVLGTSLIVATLPLIAICWYVMFLAAVGAVEQRRGELAVTALRGVPGRLRWWLPNAETLIPILLGGIPGFILGYFGTTVLAGNVLPGQTEIRPNVLAIVLAAMSMAGAVLAAMVAQWRATREPVVVLLRRVRRRRDSVLIRAAEVVVGVVALAAGYQAAVAADAGGIAMLVPLGFGLGLGLVAGRLVLGPMERLGRWLVRRGRLMTGLSALSLARRPGARAVVVLLTVGIGMLGFALTATDTATRAWAERAHVETGAPRVLSVLPVPASRLVSAVRSVDPEGRFAMAVAEMQVPNAPTVLGVDTKAMASVINWPTGEPVTAQQAAELLRPQEPGVIPVTGAHVNLAVNLHSVAKEAYARVEVVLVRANGERQTAISDTLPLGESQVILTTPECDARPCRLIGMAVSLGGYSNQQVDITIGEIRNDRGEVVMSRDQVGARNSWLQRKGSDTRPAAAIKSTPDGLNMSADTPLAVDLRLWTKSVPEPLPVMAPGDVPAQLANLGATTAIENAAGLTLMPRLGTNGILCDVEYADLAIGPRAGALTSEVWLNDQAPPDIITKLSEAGLIVQSDVRSSDRYELFSRQAPALALDFLRFAAIAALILTAAGLLVAAVLDRARREEDLRILAPQGLRKRTVQSGAVLGRAVLVILASIAGLAAALAAWLAARDVVPVYTVDVPAIPLPDWPDVSIGRILLTALTFLLIVCWVAARVSRAHVEETRQ